MTRDEDDRLQRAIEAISDGREVDWEAEGTSHPGLRDSMEVLRVLQEIGQVHRRAESVPVGGERAGTSRRAARPPETPAGSPDAHGPPPNQARPGAQSWGTLRLLERIGQGSFGEVYRAFDPALQIQVALKLWRSARDDSESDRQLLDEARRLARVRHPSVLVVHGVDEHEGRIGMWTDLIRGHTLEQLLERDGPFGASEAAVIGMDLCGALAALHAAGTVHRDVKTTNVMREQGGRIVLMDFGTVREVTAAGKVDPAQPGVGTPLAMAPEVLRGEAASASSDLHSLGVLLYRLVTFAYPVEARTVEELIGRHARRERVHLRDRRPDLPGEFVDVVECALSPDPARRHKSAGAFEQALARTLEGAAKAGGRAALPLAQRAARARPLAQNNLPRPLTSFVGRQREVEACSSLLDRSRLITLTGSPGSGKTRLALHVATERLAIDLDAAWFVDLTALVERAQVERALASAVGALEGSDRSPLEAAMAVIGTGSSLVLFDNCEHLMKEAGAVASALLDRCPHLRVLATSREPLRVAGEQIYVVPTMATPEDAMPASVMASDAGRLFVERASLADSSFRLTETGARAVAGICQRLDGIPLALELAAALVRLLSPQEILERLGSQLILRADATSSGSARHETLLAALQWSYELLDEAERAFLRRLGVFFGRWSLEAATTVCGNGLTDVEAVMLLSRLADKSLILVDRIEEAGTVYRLLGTVRLFTLDLLTGAGEADRVRESHLDYYVGLAQRAEAGFDGPQEKRWLTRLDTEHENLLAAVRWSLEGSREPEKGLRLAGALWRYWYTRGHFTLGCATLERVLDGTAPKGHDLARAKALWGAGYLAAYLKGSRMLAWFEESLSLSRRAGDRRGEARALKGLGVAAVDRGDYEAARARFEESLAIEREGTDPHALASSLNSVGAVAWRLGDYATARAMHAEGLAVAKRCGSTMAEIQNLLNLSWVALRTDAPEEARSHLSECIPLVRHLGAVHRGAEALELAAETLAARNAKSAARLYGAADHLREKLQAWPERPWRAARDQSIAGLRATLGEGALEVARAEGRALGLESALELALDELNTA